MDPDQNKTIYERKLKVLHFYENSAIFIKNMTVSESNGKEMEVSDFKNIFLIENFNHLNWYLALMIKY